MGRAIGRVATAPKRVTITTTTTTTSYTVDEPESEPADTNEEWDRLNPNLVRQRRRDDCRLFPRWRVWRAEADARWKRVAVNLVNWRRGTSFASYILNAQKDRKQIGRIALGERTVTDAQYERVVEGTRWQRGPALR